jgi:hypothetical protein
LGDVGLLRIFLNQYGEILFGHNGCLYFYQNSGWKPGRRKKDRVDDESLSAGRADEWEFQTMFLPVNEASFASKSQASGFVLIVRTSMIKSRM